MSEDPEEIVGVYKQVTEDGLVWTTEIYRWQESRVAEILTMMRELGPVDPNATAGTWPEVIRLEHRPQWVNMDGGRVLMMDERFASERDDVLVPVFAGDPERAVWRRRRWWGRGPICFSPWGREVALATRYVAIKWLSPEDVARRY